MNTYEVEVFFNTGGSKEFKGFKTSKEAENFFHKNFEAFDTGKFYELDAIDEERYLLNSQDWGDNEI